MQKMNRKNDLEFINLSSDDEFFQKFTAHTRRLGKNTPSKLETMLNKYILNRKRSKKTYGIDRYCISVYYKMEQYNNALKLAEELLSIKFDAVVVQTLFKACRKIKDYKTAKHIMEKYSLLKEQDFNILYELVHYFEFCNDIDKVHETLLRMERNGLHSLPIQQTVNNFYLRFGFANDIKRVKKHIAKLRYQKREKFTEELQETEEEVESKLEHQKYLTAMSDLTLGISHELGQPITNIRYTIQFYSKLLKEQIPKKEVMEVFDSILEETGRMGGLIKRLAPLTSRKNVIEIFDIVQRIQGRLDAEKAKIKEFHIQTKIFPQTPVYMEGDPIHFDQIINNLLLNAIDIIRHDSIMNTKPLQEKSIAIILHEKADIIEISFSDTGTGIEKNNRKKIYDPFFTTKSPGEGEGLGLFIIWNLIKSMGGQIRLDQMYKKGTRFLLAIPKKTSHNSEA